jgi:hypothetical protein
MCSTSLFYYGLKTDKGKPKETCLLYLKREVEGNLIFMGITSFFAGFFVFITWVL